MNASNDETNAEFTNPVFMKVTLQLVAAWKNDRQLHLQLVGRCEPDYQQMSRSRYIRQAISPKLPAVWAN